MKKRNSVTDLELKILNIIWDCNNCANINTIIELWNNKNKPGYTTILKTLQKMEIKGFVGHSQDGRKYNYHSLLSKEHVTNSKLKAIIDNIFSGDKISFAEYFVNSSDLDERELKKIKEIISEKENNKDA